MPSCGAAVAARPRHRAARSSCGRACPPWRSSAPDRPAPAVAIGTRVGGPWYAARAAAHPRLMTTRLHGWRRLAGASWSAPNDPQFYGDIEVDAAILQTFLGDVRRRTGVHVTVTHLVGRAVAHGLVAVPELGMRLARGREYQRESTDIFFIVADGDELTGVKLTAADAKPVVELARELEARVLEIRSGNDEQLGRTKALMERLPRPLLRGAIKLSSALTSGLNLDLPSLGLPRQPFGGAMVTSVGGWGVSHAYSPLASYYRVPLLVLVGAVTEKPVAVAGRV